LDNPRHRQAQALIECAVAEASGTLLQAVSGRRFLTMSGWPCAGNLPRNTQTTQNAILHLSFRVFRLFRGSLR